VGKSNAGLTPTVTSGLQQNEDALVSIAQSQNQNSQTLFNEANPGFQSAENFYGTLASGDPYAIARAVAPQTQQIAQATAGAKQNIMNNAPSGGEKNLALEQADVSQGAQVGQVSSGAVSGSYNALASLAGQGTGESISAAGTGISGLNSANSALTSLGGLQMQQYQVQQQAKGQQLGALSSLGGDIFSAAGSAGSLGALFAL
jgi:hypothetical protein